MRNSGHEARGIVGKDFGERPGNLVGKMVVLDSVPDTEKQAAARHEHAPRLGVCLAAVGEEHRAELAGDYVEGGGLERKRQRVGLPPCDARIR
ncbi:hypothetical protein ES703_56678 [subsurface metagenome]